MKEITIRIETENDAFFPEYHDELARILEQVAHNIIVHRIILPSIKDVNGNVVGEIKVK